MDKSARIRWSILLTALAATVAAIFYPVAEPVAAAAQPLPARVRAAPAVTPDVAAASLRAWEPLLADPFAPRRWEGAPVAAPAPVVVTAAPVVAEVVVAPPGPPPMPFVFVGRMSDNADKVVYLGRGEQTLLARAGDVLEGTYKVLDITPAQIEFEHLPSGQKQALAFPSQTN